MSYLCNRNRETKIANDKVPWMSGLVSGLQNRVRRFESARNLQKQERIRMKISNPFVFQQLTSSVVEVEKGGLSTPATPLEMLRLYSSLYKLYYRHPSACEIKQQTVFTPYDECEYFMDGCDIMLDQLYSYPLGLKWLSGNFWLVSFKISYLCLPLFYETRTTPSCHPSGCAYRQL